MHPNTRAARASATTGALQPAFTFDGLLRELALRRFTPGAAIALALALVAVTTLVNFPLQQWMGNRAPFLPFFVMLVLAGGVLGLVPGLFALLVSTLAITWFWVAPVGSMRFESAQDALMCLFFLAAGGLVVWSASCAHALVRRLQGATRDLDRALEAGNMASWHWDVAKDRIVCSARCESVLGARWARIRDGLASLHPEDLEDIRSEAERAFRSGDEFRLIGRIVRPDTGEVRWLETRGVVQRGAGGRATEVRGITMDVTERQVSLIEAREKARQMEALMEATPAFIFFSHDRDCRKVTGLAETRRKLGFAPDGEATVVADPSDRPRSFRALDAWGEPIPAEALPLQVAASTGRSVRDVRLRVELPDGRALHLMGNAQPLLDASGEPAGAVAAFVDVTELVNTEDELRHREAVYRTLAEAFPDFVWAGDASGRAILVNRRWREYTGMSLEELQREGWTQLHHPDELPELQKVWARAIERTEPVDTQYRYRRHDGHYRWFRGRTVPVLDDEGRVVQWMGTCTDITDRLEAEARVNRLAALVEATPDFVAVMRPNAVLVYMNRAGRRMVGLADDADVTAYRHLQFVPDWVAERVQNEWYPAALRDGSASGDGAVLTPDGRERPVSFVMLVHRDVRGEVEFISTYARDISARIALTDHLRLESQRKDEFLATLAHELRNPMAPIRYAAELLSKSAAPEMVERAREVIRRQSAQMTRLLDDLLDMSRITRNLVELRRETLDLRDVLRTAAEVAQPAMAAKGHRLTLALPMDPAWVDGDETRLTQVVANLLDNAAKYTPPGGHVELRLSVRGADVLVQVEDDGIGLAQEAIGRVFELFAQGRTVGDGPRNGLGIGLSVVRRLVELHGGSVGASSEGVGRGTRFDVHLPLAAPAARPVPATSGEPGVVRLFGDSPRILVVDDNRDAADSLSTLLRVKGYQVSVAYDGEGAVSAFDATQPSVVLLDLGLPDASGDQVALRLRAAARWPVRFIAITGWGQPRDRERTAAAGFEAHLVKPVDPGEVLRLLEVDGPRPSGIGSTAGPTD